MQSQQQAALEGMALHLGRHATSAAPPVDTYRVENLDFAPITEAAFSRGDSVHTDRMALIKAPQVQSDRMFLLDPYKALKDAATIYCDDTTHDRRFLQSIQNAWPKEF